MEDLERSESWCSKKSKENKSRRLDDDDCRPDNPDEDDFSESANYDNDCGPCNPHENDTVDLADYDAMKTEG